MIPESGLDPAVVAPVYALLLIDNCKLLIPQQDITTLELISDMQTDVEQGKPVVGYLSFNAELWPVFCLDNQLSITRQIPEARQVCALLEINGSYLGLLCDSIQNIERAHMFVEPIPACMRQADMLVSALAIHKEELLYVTSVFYIHEFVNNYRQWIDSDG
jgi:hypothetical protein